MCHDQKDQTQKTLLTPIVIEVTTCLRERVHRADLCVCRFMRIEPRYYCHELIAKVITRLRASLSPPGHGKSPIDQLLISRDRW